MTKVVSKSLLNKCIFMEFSEMASHYIFSRAKAQTLKCQLRLLNPNSQYSNLTFLMHSWIRSNYITSSIYRMQQLPSSFFALLASIYIYYVLLPRRYISRFLRECFASSVGVLCLPSILLFSKQLYFIYSYIS